MAKILVADDEQLIRKLIGDALTKDGHTVLQAEDGLEAVAVYKKNTDISLVILDIMMPEIDGWTVCKRIREISNVPVMLVSARSQDFDQIMGFESGADDYVTKPFSLVVIKKRIDTLLQRGQNQIVVKELDEEILIDGMFINVTAHQASLYDKPLDLTLKEFRILEMLCKKPGRVYTREDLLDRIWGTDYVGDTRTVDSHMARLRTKLGSWGDKHLMTIYGTGYKVKE
jgi:DNA-binding response OmpR family regulator